MYGNQDGFRPRSFAPVNVGDEVEVNIEAVGDRGDGIAKIKGFVLFIPNTKEGETVKVKITKVLRKVGFADVIGEGSAPATEEPAEEGAEDGEEAPAEPAEEAAEGAEDGEEAPAEEPAEKGAEKPAEEKPEDTEDFGEGEEESK